MKKQTKSVLNNNIDFIQLKLFDFSKEKIDPKKIISKRLNKHPKIQNTNQKLFLDKITFLNIIIQSAQFVEVIK